MVARKGNCKPEESQHALSGHSHDIYKSLLRENGKPTRGLADQNRGRSARWPLGKTRGRSSEDRRPEGRQSTAELEELRRALVSREKSVPCRYLYDAVGSQLYDEITELEEYYPYKAELSMLQENAAEIAKHIPKGSILVELGCGSATKTVKLLNPLLDRHGSADLGFIGVDVSQEFLSNARRNLLEACPRLDEARVEMICASYEEGMREARRLHPDATLCFLWLGSSIGNMNPSEADAFLQSLIACCGRNILLFLCVDLWKDKGKLYSAYCDSRKVTEAFIRNGLTHALRQFDAPKVVEQSQWAYRVVVNPVLKQVEMYLEAEKDVEELVPGVEVKAGERILMERSRKFTPADLSSLAARTGFSIQGQWLDDVYSMQVLAPHLQQAVPLEVAPTPA